MTCIKCGGELKHYDKVKRIVRLKQRTVQWVLVNRSYCVRCGLVRRELPEALLPYYHYDARIIEGFISGELSSHDLEYEDYPCDATVTRWKRAHEKHIL